MIASHIVRELRAKPKPPWGNPRLPPIKTLIFINNRIDTVKRQHVKSICLKERITLGIP